MKPRPPLLLPVALIVGGVLVLLNNLDLLRWEQYRALGDLWPLILVLAGIRLVAQSLLRPRAARAVAIAALVLVAAAALGYIASSPARSNDAGSGSTSVAPGR